MRACSPNGLMMGPGEVGNFGATVAEHGQPWGGAVRRLKLAKSESSIRAKA
jgi:hypothetical protein